MDLLFCWYPDRLQALVGNDRYVINRSDFPGINLSRNGELIVSRRGDSLVSRGTGKVEFYFTNKGAVYSATIGFSPGLVVNMRISDRDYALVFHRGRRRSIFLNGELAGYVTFKERPYNDRVLAHLVFSPRVDITELISLFMTLVDYPKLGENGNFFYLGLECKKFNKLWRPDE